MIQNKTHIRVVKSWLENPEITFAMDEAFLIMRARQKIPDTIHFYTRKNPTVSVGYMQKIKDSVNMEYCMDNNISVIRRTSSGGTIYTSPEQLIFSVIFNSNIRNHIKIYNIMCNCIIKTLSEYGIKAEKQGINDVAFNNKKISGSAIRRFGSTILYQATLIGKMDKNIAFKALKMSSDKLKEKRIKKPADRIDTLENILGFLPSFDVLKKKLLKHISSVLECECLYGDIRNFEKSKIYALEKKYHSDDWNFKR